MTSTLTTHRTVTQANTTGLTIDGRFVPRKQWADLDLDTLEWECKKPSWLDSAVEELRWARDCGEPRSAIVVADQAVLCHPYALTLRYRLDDANIDYEFDPFLNAWLIDQPQHHADILTDILNTYNIYPSPTFEAYLQGLDKSVEAVRHGYDDAIREGYRLPTGFANNRKLAPHQEESALALAANGGGLLADQVGLGKGGSFTCGLLSRHAKALADGKDGCLPAIVTVTKSMTLEIANEIRMWAPDANIVVTSGVKPAPIPPGTQWVVLSHDILSRRLPDLLAIKPKAFIADEAHVYKNSGAQRTKAAITLAKAVRNNTDTPYVTMATGTPMTSRPSELWSLLVILGWDRYVGKRSIEEFVAEHGTTIVKANLTMRSNYASGDNKTKRKVVDREIWPERAFQYRYCGGRFDKYFNWFADRATNPHILHGHLLDLGMVRRRKSDVMHPLPPLDERIWEFDLDQDDRERYETISNDFREWFLDAVRREARRSGSSEQRAVTYAQGTLARGEAVMQMTALRENLSSMKVAHTVQWIHDFMSGKHTDGDPTRRKLIVFVHHSAARKAILDDPSLAQYKPVSILSGGEQKPTDVVKNKELFQSDPDTRLIVCSMAAREGHTLTAAKDVYLHELPFVPSWIVQMAGRCWARMSEQYPPHEAHLHYAIARETIDEVLVKMNAVKKAMFTAVIDGECSDPDLLDHTETLSPEALMRAFRIGKKELGIAK